MLDIDFCSDQSNDGGIAVRGSWFQIRADLAPCKKHVLEGRYAHVYSFKKDSSDTSIVVYYVLLHNVRNRPKCEGANA
jgi:hypothetical protein